MAFNLEIKTAYPDLRRVYPKLKKLKARRIKTIKQTDTYFQFDDGLLKLRSFGKRNELILYNRNEGKGKRWSDYHILPIPGTKAKDFLARIFKTGVTVEKKRVLYMYGDTRIHLDTVKNLGTFIELESVVVKDRKTAAKEFAFVSSALGLQEEKEIKASYSKLIQEKQGRKK